MVLAKVCSLELVPTEVLKQFYVKGQEILVVNHNGKYLCLDARCTHAGAPLAEGVLQGDVLTCPWHGSQFRILDGAVLHGPAEKPLKTYPSVVEEEVLFIEL